MEHLKKYGMRHNPRTIAAILSADVAGFGRLVAADSEGTLEFLRSHRRAFVDPKITQYRGRIAETTDDGILAEFASVVDAVGCAVDIQRGMAQRNADVPAEKRIEFRIGVNAGDIVAPREEDIFRDGLTAAARLESAAEPGGICVSGQVRVEADAKLEVAFEDAGEHQLENIAQAVRIYTVGLAVTACPASAWARSPSAVTIRAMWVRWPDGSASTGIPG